MSAEILGALTLSDVATDVVIEDEYGSSWNDKGYTIPHMDGVRLDSQAPYGPRTITLKTVLRYTAAGGTVTHSDGAAGHVFENLSKIRKEFNKGSGLVTFTRTAPHVGNVRALVKLLDDPVQDRGARHVVRWVMTCPSGSWQDASETSEATSGVTTGGNTRIHDPKIVFASATTITHTHADGLIETITAAAGPTYPVTVDVGAGTILDNGSVDVRGDVTFSHAHWLRLDPDGLQTFSGTATINYRNRWA